MLARLAVAGLAVAALGGCTIIDVHELARDETAGRNNGTPGSAAARDYLIDRLRPLADGLVPGQVGDAAYLQPFAQGTNVVAVVPGTDLADEYVIVGAHYDGLGSSCDRATAEDQICNGATDNATGASAVLQTAWDIAEHPVRRSVVFALWDTEEDGLLGSRHYVNNPLVPLADTVAYINFDIVGANLLPSLRSTTFAIGAETGGAELAARTDAATVNDGLDTERVSAIFGLNRSDYANFIGKSVPTVFFSDATGPCYHTVDDEIGVVDFDKLGKQVRTAQRLTRSLANAATRPSFVADRPLATYADAVALRNVTQRTSDADLARFSPADQAILLDLRTHRHRHRRCRSGCVRRRRRECPPVQGSAGRGRPDPPAVRRLPSLLMHLMSSC